MMVIGINSMSNLHVAFENAAVKSVYQPQCVFMFVYNHVYFQKILFKRRCINLSTMISVLENNATLDIILCHKNMRKTLGIKRYHDITLKGIFIHL